MSFASCGRSLAWNEQCLVRSSPDLRSLIVARVVGDAIGQIVDWCGSEGIHEKPGLNFVLSDGHGLTASRFGATLYVLRRRKLGHCELCHSCHCPRCREQGHARHGRLADSRAFVVASEPVTAEKWSEVPEACVIGARRAPLRDPGSVL